MSKKYIKKNRFVPEKPERPGSIDALLMPGRRSQGDSGFFTELSEQEFMAELDQAELDELYELIEELENKDEKDN